MKTIWLAILLCSTHRHAVDIHRPATCHVGELLSGVHARDWSRLDAKAAMDLIGEGQVAALTSTDQADPCALSYAEYHPNGKSRLRLQIGDGACPRTLQAVTYEAHVASLAEAERERVCIIMALAPGGLPSIADDTFEFLWRSDDSTSRFHLWTTVSKTEGQPDHTIVSVRLTQERVRPSDVDGLPFRKGYMGCESPK
jgi:hypothetical protein